MAEQADPNVLIVDAATGVRELTEAELQFVLEHVAQAGFDPNALERARGRLAGVEWQGIVLKGSSLLPAEELHYTWHALLREEWPLGVTLQEYISSIRDVVLDETNGVFTSRYQGSWQLGILRKAGRSRGPRGFEWVLVEYRVETGRWVTAYQPAVGLGELDNPRRSDLRWLRKLK